MGENDPKFDLCFCLIDGSIIWVAKKAPSSIWEPHNLYFFGIITYIFWGGGLEPAFFHGFGGPKVVEACGFHLWIDNWTDEKNDDFVRPPFLRCSANWTNVFDPVDRVGECLFQMLKNSGSFLGVRRFFKNYWDVLLVLRINGLFHHYISRWETSPK